ncbi:serine/threonine protein kinase [Streptomyces actinomycinicus]|uniref:non-specific serine/threonine protein kinase n=1 Tax=Streptomyces actinomycinicus TaxID=1695166 RepID=A0A937JNV8_9ACTN|nr:serine/threonine-protein kinase [Streptomyces actinomycinicus]MBL1083741.1 serine/threonine protein kinase [Streptomyces actinomycinicus]
MTRDPHSDGGSGDWAVPGYAPVRTLGEGAGGRVVLARHTATGVPVAVKYLSRRLHGDREFLARFRAEARLLGELRHPCVVRLYEYVEARAGAAIVMEAVDGVSLRQLLRRHGATGPEAALVLLKGSLLGLGAAHAAGVVHRDYKPENVLVRADGTSALADFGIAVRAGRETGAAGTPAYMAPEQWEGEPAGPAGDVYAAAAVFHECLTGRRPFTGDDVTALRLQHLRAPVPLDDIPGPLRGLLRRGLAKDPADRPGIEEFLAELEQSATEGYGGDWEERSRRRLAELTALLALLFPFTATVTLEAPARALTLLGRVRRNGWQAAAGAAALAVVVTGATAVAARPHDTATTVVSSAPTAVTSAAPSPAAGTPSPAATPTAVPPTTDTTPSGSPSENPSSSPTPSVTTAPPTAPATPVTETTAPTAGTVTLTIGSWRRGQTPGTLVADVSVDATGTGPVTVAANYYVDSPADPYGNQTKELSGSTHYAVTFEADFSNHPCRGTWMVTLTSTPAAENGPQTASLDAPPC